MLTRRLRFSLSSISPVQAPRRRVIAFLTAIFLYSEAPVAMSAGGYDAFLIGTSASYAPAISDSGEIVYEVVDANHFVQIVSTFRGLLTHSTSGGVRFPDINDFGEVVYSDGPFRNGFHVFSTIRGELGPGNLPSINKNGDVISGDGAPEISDTGEVVRAQKDSMGVAQIISSTRGTLTAFNLPNRPVTATINSSGQVVFARGNALYELGTDAPISPFVVDYFPDLNDFGDIVTGVEFVRGDGAGSILSIPMTVLLTNRPEFYFSLGYSSWDGGQIQLDGQVWTPRLIGAPIPLPSSISLILICTGYLGVYARQVVSLKRCKPQRPQLAI